MHKPSLAAEFIRHYVPAIFAIAVTTALLTALRPYLDTQLVSLIYLLPVGLSTSLWGLGAGIIAALSAFLAFNYFFIVPHYTLTVRSPSDLIVLLVFLIVAVVLSQLVGRGRLTEAERRTRLLEESDQMKSTLLSSVSHELRTPLATIKAAATSLRSGEVSWDTEARANLLEAVEDEADHLNLLVSNLLNMTRIEANQLKPNRQWNLLSEVLGSVLGRMQRQMANHKIAVDLPEDLPLVPVDYVEMDQVFTNLINNSIKYAPSQTTIRVSAGVGNDSTVQVQVANEGPHVPALDLERIFDKFHRITATDRVTGTGLGLSICKGIIEAHGGKIWAENLPVGFAINFTLPLAMDGKYAQQVKAEE